MGKPTADEIRETAELLEKFAAVIARAGHEGTTDHVALSESAKFLRSIIRDYQEKP